MKQGQRILQACAIAVFFVLASAMPLWAGDAGDESPAESAGRVRFLVKWQSEVGIAAAPATVAGIESIQTWPLDWQILEVDAADAPALLAELQSDPRVATVTDDYPLELTYSPNDPAFGNGTQWALHQIGADIAWEFSRGQAITVAIVDSGIDPDHPDLAGQLVEGFDFYSETNNTADRCGHGTHVAGIVGAVADNSIGLAGLAHQARLMPVKVIDDSCRGTYSRLILGILYAVDHGARVIVITSGGTFAHEGLREAIAYARSRNVLVVVSAGNGGDEKPFYPGSFEESFTVAGTDHNDGRYDRSTHGSQIDVAAPATSIYSTYYSAEAGSTYAHMSGTSMAAPHVGGLAALVLAIDPALTVTDLETVLRQTADDLGEPGWDKHFGWGRINTWRAVAAVSPAAGNIRPGNVRIPVMAAFEGITLTTTSTNAGIRIAWQVEDAKPDTAAVIYRATVPLFEAAVDVAETPLFAAGATGNSVVDTQVVEGQTYHYWLVQADRSVEIAISSPVSTTFERGDAPDTPHNFSTFLPISRNG